MIESSIKKSNYIKEIDEKTGISENAITEDFKKYEKIAPLAIHRGNGTEEKIETKSRRTDLEKKLFGIFFWKGENKEQLSKIEELRALFEENIGSDQFKKMFLQYESISEDLSFEAEMWYCDKIDVLFKDTKEIILNLEEEILNEESFSLLLKIKEKERNKDDMTADLISRQKILEKIEDIKSRRSK